MVQRILLPQSSRIVLLAAKLHKIPLACVMFSMLSISGFKKSASWLGVNRNTGKMPPVRISTRTTIQEATKNVSRQKIVVADSMAAHPSLAAFL
jgi:hypothetical protein